VGWGIFADLRNQTRFVEYDISKLVPVYKSEYVVPLPFYVDPTAKASKNPKVAAQSEIHYIQGDQFFILSRDSNAGHGQASSLSIYRHIDVFDISTATNIKGNAFDCATCGQFKPPSKIQIVFIDRASLAIASSAGVLNASIIPATYCSFLDFNVNSQLGRFGLHNGGNQDQALLNEKWESIGLVPVLGDDGKGGKDKRDNGGNGGNNGGDGDDDDDDDDDDDGEEWYVFSLSDNDFITQDGHLDGGKFAYSDASGFNLDNQALVFKVTLPKGATPVPS
jgi:hypothetical protein